MTIEMYTTVVTTVLTLLLGLCVGSFLNVVIYRVPLNMSVAFPASHCPKCEKPIAWYDNIPVVSYLLLGGKCRHCGAPISFRYTAVEIGNTVLWGLCAWRFFRTSPVYAVIAMAVCSILLCISFIDLEHMFIPDRFQLMLAGLGIASVFFTPSSFGGIAHWYSHLIGAVAGYGVFWLIGALMTRALGQEALGGGDIKLSAVMGLLLGWQKLILAVLIASISASILLLVLKRLHPDGEAEHPFGPFLAGGFVVAMLWGDTVLNWYMMQLMG